MSEGDNHRSQPREEQSSSGWLPAGKIVEDLMLNRKPAKSVPPPKVRTGRPITGRLEAHGRANYQFQPDGSPSYYVKIVSNRGLETLWGVDLERAIRRSKTQPKIGSIVGASRMGSELVTIPARGAHRGAARQRTFRRAQWIVENITFFAESIQRARRDRETLLADQNMLGERPELRSSFISLSVAQKFADQHIRDPRDRKLFVQRVKAVMAISAGIGTLIPEPRLTDSQRTTSKPATAQGREEPTR